MASERKELVNCLKMQILVKNITKDALVEMLKHYLGQNSMSFKDFIDAHMADIKCLRRTTILYKKDVSKLIVGDKAISDIREDNLEGMLVRRLLVNLCPDLFMVDGCKTLQDFLKTNQHDIYHLFNFNEPCCQCLHDYKFPVTSQLLDEDQYKKMFKMSPCTNCTGTSGTVCSVSSCIATDYIRLDYNIKTKVFGHCSPIFKAMLKLADIRNDADGHLEKAAIPNERYDAYKRDIEESIMVLAKICGNEDKMQRALGDVEKLVIGEKSQEMQLEEFTEQMRNMNLTKDIADAVVLHAEDDRDAAIEFITNMEMENPELNIDIILYETLTPGKSLFESAVKLFDSCRFLFVFVTQNLNNADLEKFLTEIATFETLRNQGKKERLIPVLTDARFYFSTLGPFQPLKYYNYLEAKKLLGRDKHFIKCFTKLINNGRTKYLVN